MVPWVLLRSICHGLRLAYFRFKRAVEIVICDSLALSNGNGITRINNLEEKIDKIEDRMKPEEEWVAGPVK